MDLVDQSKRKGAPALALEAEQVLLEAVKKDPRDAIARGALGDFYLYDRYKPGDAGFKGRVARAKRLFQEALEIDPALTVALTGLADIHYRHAPKDLNRALALLKRARKQDPRDALIHSVLGKCYFDMRRYREAEASFLRAIVSYTEESNEEAVREARRYLARIKTDQHRFALARRLIEEAIVGLEAFNKRFHHDNGCPYQALGRLYSQMGYHQEVKNLYTRTAEIARKTPIHQFLAAVECYRAGDHAGARKYLKRTLELKPLMTYRVLEGFLLLTEKKYNEARRVFEAGVKHKPPEPLAGVGLGHLAIIRKEHAGAKALLEEVAAWDMEKRKLGLLSIDLDRAQFTYRMACLGMGWVYANQDKHDEAIKHLDRILVQRPGDTLVLLSKGNSLLAKGQLDVAESVFQKVLKVQPKNPYAMAGIGTIRHNQGKAAQAEKRFKKAMAAGPKGYTCPYQGLGLVYLKQGKIQKAKEYFKKAIKLDPNIEYKKFNGLAKIYIREGRLAEAEMLLLRSQKNFPQDGEAKELLMKLKKIRSLRKRAPK